MSGLTSTLLHVSHSKKTSYSWGMQLKHWLINPMNQICLGCTIEGLADHPNEPDLAGIYNRKHG